MMLNSLWLFLKKCLQREGAVVRRVVCGIDERDSSPARECEQCLPAFAVRAQFGEVTAPKFRPALRIMPEPGPQLGAWRHILVPLVQAELCPGHTARPQPLDQHAVPIGCFSRIICALQPDHAAVPFLDGAPVALASGADAMAIPS